MHYEYSPQVLDKLRYKFRTRLLFYLFVFKEDDENEDDDGTIIKHRCFLGGGSCLLKLFIINRRQKLL